MESGVERACWDVVPTLERGNQKVLGRSPVSFPRHLVPTLLRGNAASVLVKLTFKQINNRCFGGGFRVPFNLKLHFGALFGGQRH